LSTVADKGANDFSAYPFFRKTLVDVGLDSPAEQYTLYASVIAAVVGSIGPLRKANNLHQWLSTTDEDLKKIYAARGKLSRAELEAGPLYVKHLREIPRRWSLVPACFLGFELLHICYKRISLMRNKK
jgi:hypothetical protein